MEWFIYSFSCCSGSVLGYLRSGWQSNFLKKNLKWGLKLMYAVLLLLLLLFSIVEIEFEDCESQIVCHSQVWR